MFYQDTSEENLLKEHLREAYEDIHVMMKNCSIKTGLGTESGAFGVTSQLCCHTVIW